MICCTHGTGIFSEIQTANLHSCVVAAGLPDKLIITGDKMIGMQLKKVAVPVRLSIKNIGEAHLADSIRYGCGDGGLA